MPYHTIPHHTIPHHTKLNTSLYQQSKNIYKQGLGLYPSSSFIVMHIDTRTEISMYFSSVEKLPCKGISKPNIISASTPLPSIGIQALVARTIACAGLQVLGRACLRYGVTEPCRSYRIEECRFTTS